MPDFISGLNFEDYPELASKVAFKEGDFNLDEVKFLVYGESGVGKTVFSATWPDVVFLDIDKGTASIRTPFHSFAIDYFEDLVETAEFLANSKHPFKTVVVDSLNELQYLTMRSVIKTYPTQRRSYDSLPSIADYGKMLDEFDKAIRFIKGLPMNVVFIAQVAPRAYETDPVQPQFTGKQTARNLSRMMDVIGYLDKKETEGAGSKTRIMIFDAVNYVTKDRSDVLPQALENPTYPALYSYWQKAKLS